MSVVLVTGGTGYIGAWCIKILLDRGYKIRTSVRDPEGKKASFLQELKAQGKPIEIFKAELLDGEEVWQPIVKGSTYVLHVASPISTEIPSNPEEMTKPAMQGALTVLKCAAKENVKRFVLTSSCAAAEEFSPPDGACIGPDNWSDQSIQAPYGLSKTMAEKAAWDFMESEENKSKMEFCSVLPGLTIGAPAFVGTFSPSIEAIRLMMDKQLPLVPAIQFPVMPESLHVGHANGPTGSIVVPEDFKSELRSSC